MSEYEPPEIDDWRPGDHRLPASVNDPRELAAVVREALYAATRYVNRPEGYRHLAPVPGTAVGDAHLALDALVAECERLSRDSRRYEEATDLLETLYRAHAEMWTGEWGGGGGIEEYEEELDRRGPEFDPEGMSVRIFLEKIRDSE